MAIKRTDTIQIPIKIEGDINSLKKQFKELENDISGLSSIKDNITGMKIYDDKEIAKAKAQLKEISALAEKATSPNTGNIDTGLFSKLAKDSKVSLDEVNKNFSNLGINAQLSTKKISEGFNDLQTPISKADTALDKFGRTLINSLRYNIVNNFVDSILSKGGDVISFFEDVDKNLNNIRIVSGKTTEEMAGFTTQSMAYAREMGVLTNTYLKASEIYYQQGLATNEVITRTNATIMSANVAGQDVATTADQVTSILNGFNIEASQTVDILDKIAAVGAGTATDFEEIAKAAQKVASSASGAGMGVDDTLGMIATIASVTREAPESIGTSLNAIISRFANLNVKAGDELDEYTSKVEQAFSSTNSGLTIFDEETGLLKSVTQILTELSDKWLELDVNQQKTITSAIAGTRQANRLMALMNNWDMFEEYRDMSANSEGALEDQNAIYMESLEALKNQASVAGEALYSELFNVDMLKTYYSFLTDILDLFTGIASKTGGLQGLITTLGGVVRGPLMNMIAPNIMKSAMRSDTKSLELEKEQITSRQNEAADVGVNVKILNSNERSLALTREQNQEYNKQLVILGQIVERKTLINESDKKFEGLGLQKASQTIQELGDYFSITEKEMNKFFIAEEREMDNRIEEIEEEIRKLERLEKELNKKKSTTPEQLSSVTNSLEASRGDLVAAKTQREAARPNYGEEFFSGDIQSAKNFGFNETKIQELRNNLQQIVTGNKDFAEKLNAITLDAKGQFTVGQVLTNPKVYEDAVKAGIMTEENQKKVIDITRDQFSKQFSKELAEVQSAQSSAESDAKVEQEVSGYFNKVSKAYSKVNFADVISRGAVAASAAFQSYNVITDNTLTTQEKMVGVTNSLGTALSSIPGPVGAVGMALSTIGPIILEAFGIGVSEAEKLQNKIEGMTKSFNAMTSAVRQQKTDLSAVDSLYKNLAQTFDETAFTYSQLSDQQKSQYDQVAEYVETYAPELVKYYDTEGRAIIDLTYQYEDLKESKKSYLQLSLEANELSTYSQMSADASENSALIMKNYANSLTAIEEAKTSIAELKQSALAGKDVSEELEEQEELLASHQQSIADVGSEWNNFFSTVVTKGTKGFSTLSTEMQNSILAASSWNSYLMTDTDVNIYEFQRRIEEIITVLSELDDEKSQIFTSFSDAVRNSMIELVANLALGRDEIIKFFDTIRSEEDYIRGTFLNEIGSGNYSGVVDNYLNSANGYYANQSLLGDTGLNNASFDLNAMTGWGGSLVSDDPARINETIDAIQRQTEALRLRREERQKEFDLESDKITPGNQGVGRGEDMTKVEWDEDGNMVSAGRESNPLNTSLEDMAALDEAIASNENAIANLSSAAARAMTEYADSIRQLANESPESFNKIAESFNEMLAAVQGADLNFDETFGDFGYDSAEEMRQAMGAMYAALQGDNRDFYENWRAMNRATIIDNIDNLGVYASDYATYNEYMDAVNQKVAERKVLLEILATEGAAAADEKLNEFKRQSAIAELAQAGNKEALLQYMALDTADQNKYAAHMEAAEKAKAKKEEVLAAQRAGESEVEISAEALNTMDTNLQTFGKSAFNMLAGFGAAKGISLVTGQGTYKTSIETAVKHFDDIIAKETAAANEILAKADKDVMGKYEDLANALINGSSMPTFDYGGLDFGNIGAIGLKPIGSLGSGSMNSLGSSGGKDNQSKEKDVADLELDLDPLKRYIDQLDLLSHQMEVLQKQREQLYGKKYLDNLNKEIALQRESMKIEQQKLDKINQIADERKKELAKQGVKFDENGLITNYNELLLAKQLYTNSLAGDAKESAKAATEAFQDLMDEYEEYAYDKKRETEQAIQDLKKELADLARERIEYPIQIIVDASDKDKNIIETIADILRYQKGNINFGVTADESVKQLLNSLDTLRDITSATNGAQGFLNSILNDVDLKDDIPAQLEMIEEQQSKMQSLAEDLMEFGEKFREAFADALGEAVSILEKELKKYDNITLQYEYMLALTDQLNTQSSDMVIATYDKLADIYRNNLTQFTNVANMIKDARDAFAVGSDEWLEANEKYLDAQANVIEQEKKLAELLGQRYDSVVSTGRKELEEALFNGQTLDETLENFNKMTEERKKYLDTERKVYELSKMERDMEQEIDNYKNNPKAQASLRKFMQDELKYLQSKEKLTQADLDLSEKQYNVIKARIALEEARESKQYSLMLQRNSDGTFGYMYVQNTDDITKAEQAYEDAIDQLYQYSIKRTEELQKESITIRSDALDEFEKIAKKLKAGIIDETEAQEMLNKTFEDMKKKLEENAKAQAEMQQQVASSKLLQILGVTESQLGGFENQSDVLRNAFNILDNNGEISDLEGVMKYLGLNFDNYAGSVGDKVSQMFQDLGGNDAALNQLMEAFAKTGDSTASTIMALLTQTGDLSAITEKILEESLNGAGENFDNFLEQISSGNINVEDLFTETIKNGLDDVGVTWDNLKDIVLADLTTFVEQFDISNPDTILGKVTNNLLEAYKLYSDTLEEAYKNLMEREKDLQTSTNELNKNLNSVIKSLDEEIKYVTEVTKKYSGLRDQVAKAIEEVLKYINILDEQRKKIEAANAIKTSTSGSSSSSSSSSSTSKPSTSTSGSSSSSAGSAPGVGLAVGKRVKIVQNQVYTGAYGGNALGLASGYYNSGRTDLSIDGITNGRYRVKQAGAGWVGWFNPKALQAFHKGGQVGIDPKTEGMALLKENEAVITEREVDIVNQMKAAVSSLEGINFEGIKINNQPTNGDTNTTVYANFPNVKDAKEIEDALINLPQKASQYINKEDD